MSNTLRCIACGMTDNRDNLCHIEGEDTYIHPACLTPEWADKLGVEMPDKALLFPVTPAKPAPAAPPRKPDLARGEFRCENCDYVGMPEKKSKGNVLVTLLLFCIGILPGLIYIVVKSGYQYFCPQCGYNYKTDGVL